MSRRPKGGMGARKKVGKQEPLVSEAWGTLATTTITMLETVGSINEEANEDCIEEAAQLSEMSKKRMSFEERMQLIDAVTQMIESFLGAFAELDDDAREEHGLKELFENFYGSMFTIITESIEGNAKPGANQKQKDEMQQQLAITLRMIDALIAVSFETHSKSALEYFKPFIGTLFELCCTQLCLGQGYDFYVRHMSLSLMTELIESQNLNEFLTQPENKNLVDLVIDTCFKLCADENDGKPPKKKSAGGDDDEEGEEEEEEEEAAGENTLDVGEESSQNLGTQLLDTFCSSLVRGEGEAAESIVAPLILAKSSAILADINSTPLDRKAALVTLAVIPEGATKFAKNAVYLNTVMALLQTYVLPAHDPLVRSGAFISIAEHLQHLKPEIASFYPAVTNAIVTTLSDAATPNLVKLKSCIALQQLCAQLDLPDEFLKADSPKSLTRFLLDQIKPFGSKDVASITKDDYDFLEHILQPLRSQATAYGESVEEKKAIPAAGEFLKAFAQEAFDLMLLIAGRCEAEASWRVRGIAAATACVFTSSLSKDTLKAQMPTLSKLLIDNMNLENTSEEEDEEEEGGEDDMYEMRSATQGAFAFLAQQLGEDILPYVEDFIPFIVRALDPSYGAIDEEEPDEDDPMGSGGDENKSADEERTEAIECYETLVTALGPKFLPFQDRCWEIIKDNFKSYSLGAQRQVVQLIGVLPNLYPLEGDEESKTPTPGVDLQLSEPLKELLKTSKDILIDYVKHVTDSDIVEFALDTLATLIDRFGQIILNDSADSLTALEKISTKILKRTAPCQTMDPRDLPYFDSDAVGGFGGFGGFGGGDDEDGEGEGEEDEEEDEEEEEEESEDKSCEGAVCKKPNCGPSCGSPSQAEDIFLMESLFGVLGSLAKAKGASFQATLDSLFPRVLKLSQKKGAPYGACISGFFADLAESLSEELFAPYIKQIMPLLLADINNAASSPAVLRNTAFALGSIFAKTSAEGAKEYYESAASGLQQSLNIIREKMNGTPEAERKNEEYGDLQGSVDNVVSALGKLLVAGDDKVPRAVLLPLFIENLPVANDFSEAAGTMSALVSLINTWPAAHPGLIEPLFPQSLRIIAQSLADAEKFKLNEESQGKLVDAARAILAKDAALRGSVVDKLDEKLKAEFTKRLDSSSSSA